MAGIRLFCPVQDATPVKLLHTLQYACRCNIALLFYSGSLSSVFVCIGFPDALCDAHNVAGLEFMGFSIIFTFLSGFGLVDGFLKYDHITKWG